MTDINCTHSNIFIHIKFRHFHSHIVKITFHHRRRPAITNKDTEKGSRECDTGAGFAKLSSAGPEGVASVAAAQLALLSAAGPRGALGLAVRQRLGAALGRGAAAARRSVV